MNIRDEIITGSFMIGPDGQKEPISWKDYALELEAKIASSLPQSSTEEEKEVKEEKIYSKEELRDMAERFGGFEIP